MARPRKNQEPQVPGAEPEVMTEVPDQPGQPDQSDLPSMADIDPTTISRAVLCREGWVCPA